MVYSGLQSPRCIVVRVYGLVGKRSAETNSRTIFLSRAGSGTQLASRSRFLPRTSCAALDSDASRYSICTAQGSSILTCNCKMLSGNSVFHFSTVSIPIHSDFVEYRLLAPLLLDLVHAESEDHCHVASRVSDEDTPASGGTCGYITIRPPDNHYGGRQARPAP